MSLALVVERYCGILTNIVLISDRSLEPYTSCYKPESGVELKYGYFRNILISCQIVIGRCSDRSIDY